MSSDVPFTIMVIKPLSVGRGNAPQIISDVLSHTPLSLRCFRYWDVCDTTLHALSEDPESFRGPGMATAWVCLFTHIDRRSDPFTDLIDYCGPETMKLWRRSHLRWRYSWFKKQGNTTHRADTVVRISEPQRASLEAHLLFTNFDESSV